MRFEDPLLGFSIMGSHSFVEIAGKSGDRYFIPDIGITKAAAAHSSQVCGCGYKDHFFSQFGRSAGSYYAR